MYQEAEEWFPNKKWVKPLKTAGRQDRLGIKMMGNDGYYADRSIHRYV